MVNGKFTFQKISSNLKHLKKLLNLIVSSFFLILSIDTLIIELTQLAQRKTIIFKLNLLYL